ncbi:MULTISPECIES: acetylglutamate kinase [Sutcliffiella]|uniref:Acetylglutamate kinase n=1 Tax=Sutcliffiella cohnii TaxID=33932 RepID=A0A223KQ54_9BACI|nr:MULTISPECIES: acetylglutamate kinase [Sutcliffiella]AST91612.1 acetylglutamate kinase [Sutcliffiella cohnii]MED4014806.1 acetylglutamate kinase [Sutcliffiella cohnii]WBL17445.1 acetylglutamate kinase [Sutcliffiella sp. NC1]
MNYLVIKCGGSIFEQLSPSFFEELVQIQKEKEFVPIIVHGGGPSITKTLSSLEIETKFVNGLRQTTPEVLDVVEMILSGSLNKQIVRNIIKAGGKAIGISGVDGMFLEAKPVQNADEIGLVGEITNVRTEIVKMITDMDGIPVISPIAVDLFGQHYNINADLAAAAIAKSLEGTICLVTNVAGVLVDGEVQSSLSNKQVEQLIESQQITGGMIPKVHSAIDCLENGVSNVVIIDGTTKQSLTRFTKGEHSGTFFYLEEEMIYSGHNS